MLNKSKNPTQIEVKCTTRYDDQVPRFYRTFQCLGTDVCTALSEEVKYWSSRDPTIVQAPTGTGKTTFVYKVLIPEALRLGKNVLILSNRIALSAQQKDTIMDIISSPLKGRLTAKGIRETEDFGAVRVITYHRLPALLNDLKNKAWLHDVLFVVADEAHFFVADSRFNEKCGYYLKLLTSKFQNAIRVYLTATSWDVLIPLAEAEQQNYIDFALVSNLWDTQREFRRYVFSADYSYVNLHFFEGPDDLKEMIDKSTNEKWLVFVDSKVQGRALANALEDQALYLDNTCKGTEEWHQLLMSESFTQKVLITTPVFDCGVNLKDDKLKNIAVFTDSRTSLIQMLGRKRCDPGEEINLYVCNFSPKKLAARRENAKALMELKRRYDVSSPKERHSIAMELWSSEESACRKFFRLANGKLVPNELAFYAVGRRISFYESLERPNDFKKAVCNWLGQSSVEEPDHWTYLLQFCQDHEGIKMTEAEVEELRKHIFAAYFQKGFKEEQKERIPFLKQRALNSRLATLGIPYILQSNAWIIETVSSEDKEINYEEKC